jgi:hypothetical protein
MGFGGLPVASAMPGRRNRAKMGRRESFTGEVLSVG